MSLVDSEVLLRYSSSIQMQISWTANINYVTCHENAIVDCNEPVSIPQRPAYIDDPQNYTVTTFDPYSDIEFESANPNYSP